MGIGYYEYTSKKFTLDEIKKFLLDYYFGKNNYGDYVLNRKLIITETEDTVIFSVQGTPPKGTGILLKNTYARKEEYWKGRFILIGGFKISRVYCDITIMKGD